MKNGVDILAKIEETARKKGVVKIKIGEILGADENSTNQNKFNRWMSFKRKAMRGVIILDDLKKIANFLGVPVEHFTEPDQNKLCSPRQFTPRPPASLEQIEASLRALNYTDMEISAILSQLRKWKPL